MIFHGFSKTIWPLVCSLLLLAFSFTLAAAGSHQENEALMHTLCLDDAAQVPFVENMGQIVNEEVKYYAATSRGAVFVTLGGGIIYSLPSEDYRSGKGWVIKESFVAASAVFPRGKVKSATRVNHFIGKDSAARKTSIPAYDVVLIGEVYEGIEVEIRANRRSPEKLFYVEPGHSARTIQVRVEGADRIDVNRKGELEARTGLGPIGFTRPVAFQQVGAEKRSVDVAYEIRGHDTYGFRVGAYDNRYQLVIDPLLGSTYVGGSGRDRGYCLALDSEGNVHVAGQTGSLDYPTVPGAYDRTSRGNNDIFVSMFDPGLKSLLASTLIGGNDMEYAHCLTLDQSGSVYISGATGSTDYPTTSGVFRKTFSGDIDIFITKLDRGLRSLLSSTLVGGKGEDAAYALAIGQDGTVYSAPGVPDRRTTQ